MACAMPWIPRAPPDRCALCALPHNAVIAKALDWRMPPTTSIRLAGQLARLLARPLALLAASTLPCAAPAWAQMPVQTPPPSTAEPATSEPQVPLLESTRLSVRTTAEWVASGVDSWFGDRPFWDGGQVTDGRLDLRLIKRQDESLQPTLRFNARFRLPNLEDRAYLFLGRDNPRELINDTPSAFSRQQRLLTDSAPTQVFVAGFGFALKESVDFRLGFRGGLKPYAQLRYRHPWQLGPDDLLEFRQTLFWSVADHAGMTSAGSYLHVVSPTLAIRWLGAATITQRARSVEWSSLLGAYRSMGQQRLLSFEAVANREASADPVTTDRGLQMRWEQPVYRDWLQGELLVGHFWPRRDPHAPRGRAWALGTGVKMQF